MKCRYRYDEREQIGAERSRHGRPCPNHAKYDGYCWQHRPNLDAVVKAQKAVLWLLWGIEHGTL